MRQNRRFARITPELLRKWQAESPEVPPRYDKAASTGDPELLRKTLNIAARPLNVPARYPTIQPTLYAVRKPIPWDNPRAQQMPMQVSGDPEFQVRGPLTGQGSSLPADIPASPMVLTRPHFIIQTEDGQTIDRVFWIEEYIARNLLGIPFEQRLSGITNVSPTVITFDGKVKSVWFFNNNAPAGGNLYWDMRGNPASSASSTSIQTIPGEGRQFLVPGIQQVQVIADVAGPITGRISYAY